MRFQDQVKLLSITLDNPSSNPAEVDSFFCIENENENKLKEALVGRMKKKF